MSEETVEAEQVTRTVEAVTAISVVMTMEGTVTLQPTQGLELVRQPTETDLRMLVLYLYDQLVEHPPVNTPSDTEQSLRDRLMQLLEERRQDG